MTEIPSFDPARGAEGHIYLIEFSDGTFKVGFSATPGKRLGKHKETAWCFGISISRAWISEPHLEAKANERALIAWCTKRAAAIRGVEYFTGLRFSALRAYAATLTMERHTDASFEAHEHERRQAGALFRDAIVASHIPESHPKRRFEAGNPEHVLIAAQLCDLTTDSARLVLSNDATREVLYRYLRTLDEAYAERDRKPSNAEGLSAWDWLTSLDADGKYYELTDPLFEAARSLGFELEEQFHLAPAGAVDRG